MAQNWLRVGRASTVDRFEEAALENVDAPDNENLYLVDFYLGRRPDSKRALELAHREASRRADPGTIERLVRARVATGQGGVEAAESKVSHPSP